MPHATDRLRGIKTLPQLAAYLHDELDWPIEAGDSDDITFDYAAAELGLADVTGFLHSPDTHMEAILRDFGNKTQGEDPVIHFCEHFLSAYNKQLKIQRGVFYTPARRLLHRPQRPRVFAKRVRPRRRPRLHRHLGRNDRAE